ncbi:Trypsin-like peptidase domain-containing protein [Micromonospora nigra]|uniref:Trypsin-like peptidase domain-containing protein n=1 Tax=Micromonospora nigra TaxID=145857 RepID=A0A1C6SIA2_9ACTN|nr:trypsin-like peptidase domain-containing protein [Micromonospora nigra]SCL29019.1 Trypsin-like peptidase domain-containing protein [Micromonospora nigra]
MQPDGPYRFTHLLGGSPVGKAWAAVDSQGRFVTVAVLDAVVAATPGWREAFAAAVNNQAQVTPHAYADFSAAAPWVAYPAEAGPAVERLFRALGVDYQPVPAGVPVSAPPVSAPPRSVSAPPQPVPAVPGPPAPVSAEGAFPDPFAAPARRIQPTTRPPRRTGLWAGVVAAALAVVLGGGAAVWALSGDEEAPPRADPTFFPTTSTVDPGLKPWAEAAPFSPEERALAVATPAVVFVEAVFTGYVRDAATGKPIRRAPITFTRRCSAFVVNADGHALTSSSCVEPTEENARQIAIDAVARMLVRENQLTTVQVPEYIRTTLPKVRFTGPDPGTEPASEVYAQLNAAKGNLTTEPAIPATVVRTLPAETGNTALVKLARGNLPAVELNPGAELAEGAPVLVLGFATSDVDFRTATYQPRSKLVTITGTGRRGPVSIYRINEDIGAASHGGIALDANGRVAGMLDQDQARPDRANRVVLPAATVAGLLAEAGVANALSDTDKRYRSGLDAYFAGENATAITELDAAAQGAPTNLLAQAYRQNAVERQQNERQEAEGSTWPTVLLAGVGGALVVGLVLAALLIARRRRHGR